MLYFMIEICYFNVKGYELYKKVLKSLERIKMEKIELTAGEVMTTLNWKKSKVYYWINSGKFETVERETGTNVLLTNEQIKRLKNETILESPKEFENSFENSEKVQENTVQNVTKHYKNFSNSSDSIDSKFYNEALSTMKEMYQTFVQSQSYSMKLLTDGKSELETEMLELKAENKELSQKVLKSTNSENLKNIVIVVITILLVICFITIWILSDSLVKSRTVQNMEKVEPVQTVQTVSNRSTTEETSVTEQIQKKAGQVVIPARHSKEK